MEHLALWDGVLITADAMGWGEKELTGWSWEGTLSSKWGCWESQGDGKMPLNSLAHAGVPGPQLQPWLLLSIPRALPGAARACGSGGEGRLHPIAASFGFCKQAGLNAFRLFGQSLHVGPQCWALWMRLKPLSILTFVLANCPAL